MSWGMHITTLLVTERWSQIFSTDHQLAEEFKDGAWLCHFRHMENIFYKLIELNLQLKIL